MRDDDEMAGTTQHPPSAAETGLTWNQWLQTPPGRYMLDWEQRMFDRCVADIFGYYALQFGMPQLACLRENRMPTHLLIDNDALLADTGISCSAASPRNPPHAQSAPLPRVLARFDELPFASQSVDLAVLPHVLEFADDPHQVLREIDRILVPEGRVVLTGFNHLSLWGIRQTVGRLGNHTFLPHDGQFIAFTRIKDWLKLLGLEISAGRFGCYRPPLRSERWLQRTRFMEKAGDRWWPIFGATYAITAVKRRPGMRLIGPSWKSKKAKTPALAPASTPPHTPRQSASERPTDATTKP